jgi:hypothetical protein
MNGDYTGGAQCAGGGAGGVRFLAGSFSNIAEGGEPVERSCNTPAGLPIFFPVITVESSVAEGDGKNEAELRKAANSVMDDVEANTDKIYAKVDGKDVLATRSRRADSPLFTWVVPKNNVFILLGRDIPPGPSKAVTDGIWVKLPPLSKGHHVVKFGGSFFEGAVIQKNTYHLTVR